MKGNPTTLKLAPLGQGAAESPPSNCASKATSLPNNSIKNRQGDQSGKTNGKTRSRVNSLSGAPDHAPLGYDAMKTLSLAA